MGQTESHGDSSSFVLFTSYPNTEHFFASEVGTILLVFYTLWEGLGFPLKHRDKRKKLILRGTDLIKS